MKVRHFIFLVIGALTILSGGIWIEYQNTEKPSLENVLSPFSGGTSEQPQEKSAHDIFLTGSWYKENNATERENSMYVLSWDHRRYGIFFEFIHKKQRISDCKKNAESEPIGYNGWTCYQKWDYKKLQAVFDFLDTDASPTETDIDTIRAVLTPRVHAIKRMWKGKILILSGSPQDAASFFLLYIVKISDDLYLEVIDESDYICMEDLNCKKNLPEINSDELFESHWKFMWRWIDDGQFSDPIMKDAYDMLFYVEKNWKDVMETAPNW